MLDVPEQDRLADAVVRSLGEGAGARDGAAAIVEPVSRDVPAGNLDHEDLHSQNDNTKLPHRAQAERLDVVTFCLGPEGRSGSPAAVGQCLRLVCFRPVIIGGTSPASMSAFEKWTAPAERPTWAQSCHSWSLEPRFAVGTLISGRPRRFWKGALPISRGRRPVLSSPRAWPLSEPCCCRCSRRAMSS